MKKIFLIILLILLKITLVEAKEKIFILSIVNNEPITNIDVINEAKYLSALNPKIQSLSKEKILSIAKESLIKEKITEQTKAIIVVHQFGHAAHMDEILAIAKEYDLKVIEDNAESIGGRYKGEFLGTFGDVATYSFFGNKIITTGEGGAVLTNDKDTAIMCRELRDHGMNHKKKYHHNF